MKLNGCLPRSGRCTASATSHNAPLARRNQGMMLLRASIRSNAAAAKSRRLSQAKKPYVSVVRSPHVHTRVDPPSARACVVVGDVCLGGPGAQRRVSFFPILTATPLISVSPGRDPEAPVGTDRSRVGRRLARRSRTTFWEAVHSLRTCRGAASTCRPRAARPRCTCHGRVPCLPCRATHTRRLQWPLDHDRRPRWF
jgi:hypothetical protein